MKFFNYFFRNQHLKRCQNRLLDLGQFYPLLLPKNYPSLKNVFVFGPGLIELDITIYVLDISQLNLLEELE